MDDVPLLGHRHATPQCLKILNTRLSTQPTVLSTPKKKTPKKATATITTNVVTTTSCRVGQVTWRSSTRTSCRNSPQRLGYCIKRSQSARPRDSGTSPDMAWLFNRSACNAIYPRFPTSGLAGEEGFEPPHPVLETGGLPLNLLPFTLSNRRWRLRRVDSLPSFHFTVGGMFSTRIAKFLCLHPVGMLLFVLGGRVIPVLTIVALQGNDFAHSAGLFMGLLDVFGDGSRAHGVAAFADGEAQPAFQRHRRDQRNLRRYVVSRHDHLHSRRQLHVPGHVRGPKIKLRPVPAEKRRVPPALFLGQHVSLGLELGVRRDRTRLGHHLPALHLFFFRAPQ